jgi:hypothetical protein
MDQTECDARIAPHARRIARVNAQEWMRAQPPAIPPARSRRWLAGRLRALAERIAPSHACLSNESRA